MNDQFPVAAEPDPACDANEAPPGLAIRCGRCAAARAAKPGKDGPKLPRGWQRMPRGQYEGIWCEDCWEAAFVMRAITLPVAGPIVPEGGDQEQAWEDLRGRVRKCWRTATDLANWMVREMARSEPPKDPETGRLPGRPVVDLYQRSKIPFPGADPATVSALCQSIGSKYNKHRVAVEEGVESLPLSRYPQPYPVRADAWAAEMDRDGVISVRFRVEARWWHVRIRRDAELNYQIKRLLSVLRDGCKRGQMDIVGYKAGPGDHRNGLTLRLSRKNLPPLDYRVMVKIAAWVPRGERGDREGRTLYVRTGTDTLWTYHVGDDGEPLHYHADEVRRLEKALEAVQAEARQAQAWERDSERRNQRFGDDLKHERRNPAKRRRRIVKALTARSEKFVARMDSFTHAATKTLAEFARRQHASLVVYDDTNQAFSQRFPWAQLRDRLKTKLEERGIAFERAKIREDHLTG